MGISFGRIATSIKGRIDQRLERNQQERAQAQLEKQEYDAQMAIARKKAKMQMIPVIAKAEAKQDLKSKLKGIYADAPKGSGFWGTIKTVGTNAQRNAEKDASMFNGAGMFGLPDSGKKSGNGMDFSIPQIDMNMFGAAPKRKSTTKRKTRRK